MSKWATISLGDVASQINRAQPVKPTDEYRLLGVRLEGNGAFHRETVSGAETSAARLSCVEAGDFIYSRLFAWRGAFGVIGSELDGAFVSNEFPLFRLDDSRIDSRFLNRWCQLPTTWKRVEEDCAGSTPTTRNRFKEEFFLKLEIPLPSLSEQHAIVGHLDAIADKTRKIIAHLDAIEADADAMLRSYLFGPRAKCYEKMPMADMVSLRSPDIGVQQEKTYRFAGVYSFGRGVFASAVKNGSDFAYERLSAVRTGDFTYPKLMAWEGALGVVPPECDGMVVSPEFPVFTVNTDVVLPEVLDIYFRTPSVWPGLAALSGGTNLRRRRLQPTALLEYALPIPPMATQRKLRDLNKQVAALKARHAAIREANAALLPAMLERLFAGQRRAG